MSSLGDLVANLTMNTAGFTAGAKRGAKEVDTLATRISGRLQSMGTEVVAGLINPVTAAVTGALSSVFALGAMIENARAAQDAGLRLESVLLATGGAAGFTAAELSEYASELQSVTNFEDDATRSAMTLLATYTNVNGQVFKDAIRLAQDMSAALGDDLESSVQSLGRALNDPAKGLRALKFLTAEQRQEILKLSESGNLAAAQMAILQAAQERFGGAAQATAEPLKQLMLTLGDFSETLGMPVLNAINNTIRGLRSLSAAASDAIGKLASPELLRFGGNAAAGLAATLAGGAIGGAAFQGIGQAAQSGLFDDPRKAIPQAAILNPDEQEEVAAGLHGIATEVRDINEVLFELWQQEESHRQSTVASFFEKMKDDIDLASGAATELDIRLRELERQGFTGEELDQARKQLEELERLKAQKETAPSVSKDDSARSLSSSAAAAVAGSREALSIIARSTNSARDPLLRTAEKQLVEVKKQTRLLDDISDDVRKQVQLEVVSL